MRHIFVGISVLALGLIAGLSYFLPHMLWSLALVGPVIGVGIYDMAQNRHTIRKNFPVIGHFRYLFEAIRPEINQYFIESNSDGTPFSRELRSVVYQRGKKTLDTIPSGTRTDVYEVGYEWLNHSLAPKQVDLKSLRVTVGNAQCSKPYSASLFNISAMSYGSLSKNAIIALNEGARIGGFFHDTGEGGLSPYHLQGGGDIVWEIGTAYFSCRTADGKFDAELFREKSQHPNVKMTELKLSQGAKPSHGGILPAAKVTAEIAAIRCVPVGQDVHSPPAHSAFSTPIGLLEFLAKMRELSGGKPVGFKLCIGKRREFLSICKAMIKTGIYPDFITVDGGEGGTGAAPLEFANSVGCPLREALIFVHNSLVGFGLRKHVKIIASGKIIMGFDIIAKLAIGADICNSARGMMMALGCIQALRCNSNNCPTGVATQDPRLVKGLVIHEKRQRVASYQRETVRSVGELLGAMGLTHSAECRPWHVMKRTGFAETKHFGELYEFIPADSLLGNDPPVSFARALRAASPEKFESLVEDDNVAIRYPKSS